MEQQYAIHGTNLQKKFKNFTLDIPELKIPQGFATALIGENGAGKTTLLNILSGIRLDHTGTLSYFGGEEAELAVEGTCTDGIAVKEKIGYLGDASYYLPKWSMAQVREMMPLLFDRFHEERFDLLCEEMDIGGLMSGTDTSARRGKKNTQPVSKLSDGNRMKLMLAGVFARDTELLLLDEPASPLDPLMREKLNDMLRTYLAEGEEIGESRTVFFSTHNISDMENVTDYAVIMEHGRIVEEGFVEALKEKYVMVKGNREDLDAAQPHLFTKSESKYGFEGMMLTSELGKAAGLHLVKETPNLFQISVAVMRHYSVVQ